MSFYCFSPPFFEFNEAENRALHAHLQPKMIASYAPTLMRNARQHILDLIDIPDKHQEHAKKFVIFPILVSYVVDPYCLLGIRHLWLWL